MEPTLLEQKLGVRFKDPGLMDQALVHPSYLNELPPGKSPVYSYERMEFLGDAVLGVTVTLELFKRCPDLPEGQLTKLRSSLVSGTTLARIARRQKLGQHLMLGKGEESSGGRDRESNLAAALEALVAAVFLDRGFETARKFVVRMTRDEMDVLLEGGIPEDPKSRLQELVQGMVGLPPDYRMVESGGPDHDKGFDVEVIMDGQVMGRGHGRRKAEAEKMAAQEALHRLETSSRV